MNAPSQSFWRGKRVLITGHTGFKGGWMALWLAQLQAQVAGIGLPPTTPFYDQVHLGHHVESHFADLRDVAHVARLCAECAPEIILHMAAQALVRTSFDKPQETFATNVMGTVNLLTVAAQLPNPPAIILTVTSDKVYRNRDDGAAFSEHDPLGGDDPYSASKACAELVSAALGQMYSPGIRLVTARAGNVIGGGDYATDRLVPDLMRAWRDQVPLQVRAPQASRPWQHVLDANAGYLRYVEALAAGQTVPGALNFGPAPAARVTVAALIALIEKTMGCHLPWQHQPMASDKPEKQHLALDPTQALRCLGWQTQLSLDEAVAWTVAWYQASQTQASMADVTRDQIAAYGTRP